MKTIPAVGTRVRLTKKFLQSTGQYTGSEPFKKWTVVECACDGCKGGNHVAVDEKSLWADENPDMPPQRHLCIGNLETIK